MSKLQEKAERRTINLWPDAGRALGLGKYATYGAAERGDFPGAIRIGGRWLVLREPFERVLKGENRGAVA
jgi:predicted DNA-binding transcriptional regulator AlpA